MTLLLAPIIPAINDREIEAILQRAAAAGASQAGYILLRLPHEVADLFKEWLATHYPERASHVISLIRQASGGRDYDSRFGHRQRGQGAYADMIKQRFNTACVRYGLGSGRQDRRQDLDCSRFQPPGQHQLQLQL